MGKIERGSKDPLEDKAYFKGITCIIQGEESELQSVAGERSVAHPVTVNTHNKRVTLGKPGNC